MLRTKVNHKVFCSQIDQKHKQVGMDECDTKLNVTFYF
jgi:hypothetical protein